MTDVSPKLLKQIKTSFEKKYKKSHIVTNLQETIDSGNATYNEVNEFAIEVGELLAKAFQENLSEAVLPDGRMYFNIAKAVVEPMMKNNYDIVSKVAAEVQNILNASSKIGIKAIEPALNQDRIDGIINRISNEEHFDEVKWILGEPVVNFTQSIVDDSIKANAEFQYKAGLTPKIIRTVAGNCCEWCRALAGEYSYPDVPKDVYRRHQRCRCTVNYHPGDGKVQNVHTKEWKTKEERDIIEQRKITGLKANDSTVQKYIREEIIPKQNINTIAPRQEIHRKDTELYRQRKAELQKRGQFGPSYLTISDEEVLQIVKKYSGKGEIKYNRNGKWDNKETIVTNEQIVGVVVNNINGKSVPTSVFKIHYAKDGIHIVPDYPSKKR